MKYHNNNDNIKEDFGYTRLHERYKTCVKCRTIRLNNYDKYKDRANEYSKQYNKEHKEQKISYSREYIKKTTICDVCVCVKKC